MYLWGSLHASCPAQFLSTELWPLRVSAHLLSPCKLSQQVLWSGMALGILLGSLGLPLLFYSHLCMPGLPCTWFREVGGSGLNLSGTNGSHGPQTPGSRPACDTGRQRLSAKLLWKPSGDFTDSDSDDFEEAEGRYFRVSWEKPCWGWGGRQPSWELPSLWSVPLQLSQQSRCPDFFLFLCRLLSPLLKAFAQAATFLHQGQLPDTGRARASLASYMGRLTAQGWGPGLRLLSPTELGYTEQLLQFLQANAQEEGFFGESQVASPGSPEAGKGLPVAAAPCWAMTSRNSRKEGCTVERVLTSSLSPILG